MTIKDPIIMEQMASFKMADDISQYFMVCQGNNYSWSCQGMTFLHMNLLQKILWNLEW